MTGNWQDLLLTGAAQLGVPLDSDQLARFALFVAELKKWNRRINLTAITSDQEIVVKHLIDSFTLTAVLPNSGRLLDIGSGGGFPAIPLAIVYPGLSIVSVDAVGKKITFQRHIGRLLSLNNLVALHVRAEELAGKERSGFDWVVSRAFSSIPLFARLALPFLKPEGTIVAMKGRDGEGEAVAAAGELGALGLGVEAVNRLELPGGNATRTLVQIRREGRERIA